jgi:hypothetical protein
VGLIIRINMHREATRPLEWSLGGGVKFEKGVLHSLTFYEKYFYLSP